MANKTNANEFIKKELEAKPKGLKQVKPGDVWLIEVEVVKCNAEARSDDGNDVILVLEKGIEHPTTVEVNFNSLRIKAKVKKPNLWENAKAFFAKKFDITDDDDLVDMIDQFGGKEKVMDLLRQQTFAQMMDEPATPRLPSKSKK